MEEKFWLKSCHMSVELERNQEKHQCTSTYFVDSGSLLLYYCHADNMVLPCLVLNSVITFDSVQSAQRAKASLNGADIYSGCCTLKIEYAKVLQPMFINRMGVVGTEQPVHLFNNM